MINRVFAVVAALLTLLAIRPLSGHAAQAVSARSDAALLRTAALRLGTHQPDAVATWMRHRAGVRSATVGRDGRTLDVRFVDGQEMLVLPRAVRGERLSALSPARIGAMRPHLNAGARAAVLEPFATELGLGSDAGTPEVNALQAAGFAVTTGIDQQVSVDSLLSLSQDNVRLPPHPCRGKRVRRGRGRLGRAGRRGPGRRAVHRRRERHGCRRVGQ